MRRSERREKLRILALLTDGLGGHGGIARYNHDFLMALTASPAVRQVVALPRHGTGLATAFSAKMWQAPPTPSRIGFICRALAATVTRQPPDVVFCGHLYMVPLAAFISRVAKAPLWLQVHGIEAWKRPSTLVINAARRASMITAVSRHTRARFLAWAEVDPARVRVLPNTVEPRFSPGPRPEHLATRLGLAGRRVLLTVSRLDARQRHKGQDRVIAAMPALLGRHPDAVYLVAGDGNDRSRLEQLAEELGVAKAVRFLGRVSNDDLVDLYRLADVFVMPSTGEGFGIVFLEAAACGTPVISGNRDGSVDALADGANGVLVDPGDPVELAARVSAALEGAHRPDPETVSRFAFENFAAHAGSLLESLARSTRGREKEPL